GSGSGAKQQWWWPGKKILGRCGCWCRQDTASCNSSRRPPRSKSPAWISTSPSGRMPRSARTRWVSATATMRMPCLALPETASRGRTTSGLASSVDRPWPRLQVLFGQSGLAEDSLERADLDRLVAVDRHREEPTRPRLLVDVVGAADTVQRPSVMLQRA